MVSGCGAGNPNSGGPPAIHGARALRSADWAIGASGMLLRYSGCQWSVYRKVSAGGLYGLAMLSASDGWAVGDNGSAYHFIDGDWRQVAMSVSDRLLGIVVVSPQEAWAVGEHATILPLTPGQ